MTALHTAQQRSVARAWLHRHGFTAARLVEDLRGWIQRAARLVEDLRGWIQRAEGYVARREGER